MPREKKQASKSGYAFPKPTLDELLASQRQANRVTVEFLKVDVGIALTFSGIALTAANNAKKLRNVKAARRGYDTVVGFLPRTEMSESDAEDMRRNLRRLKSELRQLGEKF